MLLAVPYASGILRGGKAVYAGIGILDDAAPAIAYTLEGAYAGIPNLIRAILGLDSFSVGGDGSDGTNSLEAAKARGMKTFSGKDAPDRLVGVLQKLGKPMDRVKIGNAIHRAKDAMNMGATDDIIFDFSGGLWDSRNGVFIGKIWEL